jgi:hypothetical protein
MEQTIKRVVDLENKLEIKTGNQPDIESNSSYLQYHIGPEFNAIQFDDREGYKIRFAIETEKITQLVFLLILKSRTTFWKLEKHSCTISTLIEV